MALASALCLFGAPGPPHASESQLRFLLTDERPDLVPDLFVSGARDLWLGSPVWPQIFARAKGTHLWEPEDFSSVARSQNENPYPDEEQVHQRRAWNDTYTFRLRSELRLGVRASAWYQLYDAYLCEKMMSHRERSHKFQYAVVRFSRAENLWLGRDVDSESVVSHALSSASSRSCWVPCSRDDWGGMCDHHAVCLRRGARLWAQRVRFFVQPEAFALAPPTGANIHGYDRNAELPQDEDARWRARVVADAQAKMLDFVRKHGHARRSGVPRTVGDGGESSRYFRKLVWDAGVRSHFQDNLLKQWGDGEITMEALLGFVFRNHQPTRYTAPMVVACGGKAKFGCQTSMADSDDEARAGTTSPASADHWFARVLRATKVVARFTAGSTALADKGKKRIAPQHTTLSLAAILNPPAPRHLSKTAGFGDAMQVPREALESVRNSVLEYEFAPGRRLFPEEEVVRRAFTISVVDDEMRERLEPSPAIDEQDSGMPVERLFERAGQGDEVEFCTGAVDRREYYYGRVDLSKEQFCLYADELGIHMSIEGDGVSEGLAAVSEDKLSKDLRMPDGELNRLQRHIRQNLFPVDALAGQTSRTRFSLKNAVKKSIGQEVAVFDSSLATHRLTSDDFWAKFL
eukprot:g2915.t1